MCVCSTANASNQLAPVSVFRGWVYRSHAHSEFTWVPRANQHLHGFYMPSTALLFKRQAHSSLGQVPTALFAVFSSVSCFNLFGLSGFCFLLYQELAFIHWTNAGGFSTHVYNTFESLLPLKLSSLFLLLLPCHVCSNPALPPHPSSHLLTLHMREGCITCLCVTV